VAALGPVPAGVGVGKEVIVIVRVGMQVWALLTRWGRVTRARGAMIRDWTEGSRAARMVVELEAVWRLYFRRLGAPRDTLDALNDDSVNLDVDSLR